LALSHWRILSAFSFGYCPTVSFQPVAAALPLTLVSVMTGTTNPLDRLCEMSPNRLVLWFRMASVVRMASPSPVPAALIVVGWGYQALAASALATSARAAWSMRPSRVATVLVGRRVYSIRNAMVPAVFRWLRAG
jgi:hypothetical protein